MEERWRRDGGRGGGGMEEEVEEGWRRDGGGMEEGKVKRWKEGKRERGEGVMERGRERGRAMATYVGGCWGGGSSSCSLKKWHRRTDCCPLEASHRVSGERKGKGERSEVRE